MTATIILNTDQQLHAAGIGFYRILLKSLNSAAEKLNTII